MTCWNIVAGLVAIQPFCSRNTPVKLHPSSKRQLQLFLAISSGLPPDE